MSWKLWIPCSLAATIALLLLPLRVAGIEITPFSTRNQHPLVQIYGLPTAEAATLVGGGRLSARLGLDIASNFAGDTANGEALLLDGETYRSTISWRYGANERLEIGLDLPLVGHAGGFLDGFIESWHETFHLPEGGREESPHGRLAYRYERNGQPLIDLTDSSAGLGDLRLNAAWQLLRETGARPGAAALRLSLKLPTGDSHRLLGSGSTDTALSLNGQCESPIERGRLGAFASLGALLMTDGDVLKEQRRNLAAFGSLGFGWAPNDRLTLKLQVDGHTAMYRNSRLEKIDSGSLQLVMGGSLLLSEPTILDFAVSEDLVVDTAPDVVFHLAVRTIF